MKRLILYISACIIISCTSCGIFDDSIPQDSYGNNSSSENSQTPEDSSQIAKTEQLSKATLDSFIGANTEIISLKAEMQTAADRIEVNANDIKSLKNSKTEKLCWVAIILSLLALAISLIAIWKVLGLLDPKKMDKQDTEIQSLKILVNQYSQNNYNQIKELKKRLINLENYSSQPINITTEYSNRDQKGKSKDKQSKDSKKAAGQKTEIGYFGDIIGGKYFRELKYSKDDAVFSAEVLNNTALFQPISLDVLRGNDNPRSAIEFTGCNTNDATSMDVVSLGKAVKDGSDWIIKEKAKIKLT